MKVHAVAKVRLDADGRVTGVEWGPVNTESNEWHTEPQVADVSEVVAALEALFEAPRDALSADVADCLLRLGERQFLRLSSAEAP